MGVEGWFRGFVGVLFGAERFDRVVVERAVVDDIVGFARSAYPKEFIALLDGKVRDRSLFVSGLLYQTSFTSENSALVQLNMLPLLSGVVGSVHSHPSFSNLPSRADFAFFNKQGPVHFIICRPFSAGSIACYSYGRGIPFSVA